MHEENILHFHHTKLMKNLFFLISYYLSEITVLIHKNKKPALFTCKKENRAG